MNADSPVYIKESAMASRSSLPLTLLSSSCFTHLPSCLSTLSGPSPRRLLASRRLPGPFCSQLISLSFSTASNMSQLEVELTAPNGTKWLQPLGLYINGEFVKSSNEQKITSINPA